MFFILMLQTPSASGKKSAPTTPVTPVAAASPNKKKPPVAAAPGESSDTTDISEDEGSTPAVVSFISRICFISLYGTFKNKLFKETFRLLLQLFISVKVHFVCLFPDNDIKGDASKTAEISQDSKICLFTQEQ